VIARELSAAGGAAIPALRALFGPAYFDASGAMDRAKVRAKVFADPAAKKSLEALLHPMIRAESERRIAAATGPYVIFVVPLLIESGNYRSRVQRVAVVDCPKRSSSHASPAAATFPRTKSAGSSRARFRARSGGPPRTT
jgi:dephospho-CoA kinase